MGRKRHPEPLTPAEQRVLEEVRTGATNAEIAIRLGLSINTVKYHVANMLAKTGLDDRRGLREWRLPREGKANWWMRAAVVLGGLGVVVAVVVALVTISRDDIREGREAWLAYPADPAGPSERLVLQELVTGRQEEILAGDGWIFLVPQWSPDGEHLAVGAANAAGDGIEVRIYDRESLRQRATIENVMEPYWSPDSSRLAGVGVDLVVIADVDGGVIASQPADTSARNGNPGWSPDSRWFAIAGETTIRTWERDGTIDQIVFGSLPWPLEPASATMLFFNDSSEVVLLATPNVAGRAVPMFGSLNLASHALTIRDAPFEEADLSEYATIAAARPDVVVRPPEFSVDGRGRYYMIYPSQDRTDPAEVTLIVVTGAGTFETAAAGFGGPGSRSLSMVLTGDWPDAPSLAANPTPVPSP